ncbi:MAG: ATP-binding protein [Spirochaetia bacterium]|nr:ATP-binding protein [Spirochaetia bacterium]
MKVPRGLVIAVASGKGGTGKTTLAAHLALAGAAQARTILVDLDVEAPDSLVYFPEAIQVSRECPVKLKVPFLVQERCSGCGACAKACHFGAIVALGGVVTIDQKLCKGCGRCVFLCPEKALEEREIVVGRTRLMKSDSLDILEGRMDVGDIRSTAVIEAAKARAASLNKELQVRDCPPGVSCPATHAVEGSDFVLLVAEPTAFSLHDLAAAISLVKGQGIKAGVVINKYGFGDADIESLCRETAVPVIGQIEFNRRRASSGARGKLWTDDESYMQEIHEILKRIAQAAQTGEGGLV